MKEFGIVNCIGEEKLVVKVWFSNVLWWVFEEFSEIPCPRKDLKAQDVGNVSNCELLTRPIILYTLTPTPMHFHTHTHMHNMFSSWSLKTLEIFTFNLHKIHSYIENV